MLKVTNDEILSHTEVVEKHFSSASSAPLELEKFLIKSYNSLHQGDKGYPREIKIPKSLDRLMKGDLEPARIITIPAPIIYDNLFPMWTGDSTKGIYLRGIGYKNGDSRFPSDLRLDDTNIHALLAGVTGHGKSVTLNSVIYGVAYEYAPWEVKITMADAKVVEFKKYAMGNTLPHISSIAATTDSDYIISVLEDLYEEMLKVNAMFAKNGVRDIIGFREKTGLAFPRNLIPIDEFQTAFKQAQRKSKRLIELFDLFGRLGRSTGYHLVLCSQEPGDVPKETLSNIKVRMALGCTPDVSTKVIGNDEGKLNYGYKGKIIINTNSVNGDKKDNVHYRVPYQSDSLFERQKEALAKAGEEYGFAYNLSFYDEDLVLNEEEYKSEILSKGGRTDRLYLGEPSFVLRDPEGDNYVKLKIDSKDIENILIYCATSVGTERYLKMFKYNVLAMGNKVINNFFVADSSLGDRLEIDELSAVSSVGNLSEFRDFDNIQFQQFMDAVYTRRLWVEADTLAFTGHDSNQSTDEYFYEVFEKNSVFDSELNRRRASAILYLLSQEFYKVSLGLQSATDSVMHEKRIVFLNTGINYYKSMGCGNGERLTTERLKPIYNWIIGADKVIGLGRDSKPGKVAKLKKILQDCYVSNIRFIVSTVDMMDLSDLKSGFRYVIMDGLDETKAKRAGVEEYPESVSKVLGVFYDKYMEGKEALKFKKISLGDEIL